MEKIVISELLKDCPEGMELDCTIWDNVKLHHIDNTCDYPIYITIGENCHEQLTKHGQLTLGFGSKCVIFPKGKTTWEGFTPPCKFKDGDIISNDFGSICIFNGEGNIKGSVDFYCGIDIIIDSDELLIKDVKDKDEHFGDIDTYKLASEEEKQKLFDIIKTNGYKWNPDTKTLEKLDEPKFKVGDTARHEEDKTVIIIIEIKDYYYVVQSYDQYGSGGYQYTKIPIKDQDQYKLFNLDISTLGKIEPKFKVGDKIRLKNDKNTIETINYIFSDSYRLYSDSYGLGSHHLLFFKEQDEWELVPDKFNISTLKPFDKVLGRTDNTGIWECDLFSCYNDSELYNNFHCIGVNYRYCIPYEGNEHLLGTTGDCDDFYKTWEE